MAVTGLPDPRPDHAILMARFAKDIMEKMTDLCQQLEVILGPDTGDLCLRIGLHSGAVTAGVLRGEKSRFQLFGDTVNTAARMESTGAPNKIQLSTDTALLLQAAGKKWAKKREDAVEAKGKGRMETYWLATGRANTARLPDSDVRSSTNKKEGSLTPVPVKNTRSRKSSLSMPTQPPTPSRATSLSLIRKSTSSKKLSLDLSRRASLSNSGHAASTLDRPSSVHATRRVGVNSTKTGRLVKWNTEVLSRPLKQIVARRKAMKAQRRTSRMFSNSEMDINAAEAENTERHSMSSSSFMDLSSSSSDSDADVDVQAKATVLEEVKDIIHLPLFDAQGAQIQDNPGLLQLDAAVKDQLLEYVTEVASMYRYNPFHNFEHASHVTMSVTKLLSRIVAPDAVVENGGTATGDQLVKNLHDHTYGITSDPLTQFAVVLSALIHDLDHPGVPNVTLVKEGTSLAEFYHNQSVAEQNSVDLAWEVLMGERYLKLRRAIYTTKEEKKRFRQLIVNTVMATDIVDQDLKKARNARWDKAFQEKTLATDDGDIEDDVDQKNRKATIVIEHLIQASDIAHTMQHWHIYRKWNERFFEELYNAYLEGRSDTDPSEFWYKGEIGFFDFYIIPLAKKLKECGVFGVSSDEYLNYAEANRKEWEVKGHEVVASYIAKYGKKTPEEEAAIISKMEESIIGMGMDASELDALAMNTNGRSSSSSSSSSDPSDSDESVLSDVD